MLSAHDTVSSPIITALPVSDHIMMSGRSAATDIYSEKPPLPSRSDLTCQSSAEESMLDLGLEL